MRMSYTILVRRSCNFNRLRGRYARSGAGPSGSRNAQPQQTSNSANKKKQDKTKAAQAGKQKAAARKAVTGRDHQGNHDSLTKPTKKGAKGDKHMNGVKQSGAAGSSNN